MRSIVYTSIAVFVLLLLSQSRAATSPSQALAEPAADKRHLQAFRSEEELKGYLIELGRKRKPGGGGGGGGGGAVNATVEVTASTNTTGTSITNVQHAGVDEGGIVKLHGNHLVVLRRGRLFTVRIGDRQLRPISSVDAFGPDIDPNRAWYDELLIAEDTVAVIGFSYERGGTEIGLFEIDPSGRLKYRSTYHLRSNDYYSSRNYASRLIGRKLIFYSPTYLALNNWADDIKSFPSFRKWRKGGGLDEFRRIAPATRIYRGVNSIDDGGFVGLHTVTACDLSTGDMSCEATSVIGDAGSVFYISGNSVYVWTTAWLSQKRPSMLYRMPLDGSAPSAMATSGSPVDQFSFLESDDGHLNVLVRSDSAGGAMWSGERSGGDVALMRVSLDEFSDGSGFVPISQYRRLPKPEGYVFQNRFVGDYVLYGTGNGWDGYDSHSSTLFVTKWNGGEVTELPMRHGIDRIDSLGSHAIAIGTDGADLAFSTVRLDVKPRVVDRFEVGNSSQGEMRSHGFFYKPDNDDKGLLGLPIRAAGRPGSDHLFEGSASIVFLNNSGLKLRDAGVLWSKLGHQPDDGCKASCVDWYGNSRPVFAHGRIFALLGYEIVEGTIDVGRIREIRRADFTPREKTAAK